MTFVGFKTAVVCFNVFFDPTEVGNCKDVVFVFFFNDYSVDHTNLCGLLGITNV